MVDSFVYKEVNHLVIWLYYLNDLFFRLLKISHIVITYIVVNIFNEYKQRKFLQITMRNVNMNDFNSIEKFSYMI